MGACLAQEEEPPVETPEDVRRARAAGMQPADNASLTSQELNELTRREAMTPMKINCQTDKGKVMPCFYYTTPFVVIFILSQSLRSKSRCAAGAGFFGMRSVSAKTEIFGAEPLWFVRFFFQ